MITELNRQTWANKAQQFRRCKAGLEVARKALIAMADGATVASHGVKVATTADHLGAVDYKQLASDLAAEFGVDLTAERLAAYRRPSKARTSIRTLD